MKHNTPPPQPHESHSFCVLVAATLQRSGQSAHIEKAIILKEFYGLCAWRVAQGNVLAGHGWWYATAASLSAKFPYMNPKSIARWMNDLQAAGFIYSIINNKHRYDVTKSYTVNVSAYDSMARGEYSNSQNEKWVKELSAAIERETKNISHDENCISHDEKTISQNEERISQNEKTLSRNEETIHSLTYSLNKLERESVREEPNPAQENFIRLQAEEEERKKVAAKKESAAGSDSDIVRHVNLPDADIDLSKLQFHPNMTTEAIAAAKAWVVHMKGQKPNFNKRNAQASVEQFYDNAARLKGKLGALDKALDFMIWASAQARASSYSSIPIDDGVIARYHALSVDTKPQPQSQPRGNQRTNKQDVGAQYADDSKYQKYS